MNIISRYVFPRILNLVMSTEAMTEQRKHVLAPVSGKVFEMGFGTGLNMPYYPPAVESITTVDKNPGMNKFARKRIAESSIPVEHHVLNGESLPLDDESFDAVVSTWTLCSIDNVDAALAEMRRVLRPEGKFYFIEHGLSDEEKVRKWQNRLNPIQMVIGDGCRLNRNIGALIREAGFQFEAYDNFYMPKEPKIVGYIYRGVAVKN